ncbi:PIN domain-containing protein [Pyrodictium abyssi]|uniref:Ribonuclease VapC n=1 Tax=Pyrodictium abyssi TaxID=54256 RepID=A0ABN6ZU54_9CREN|nr:PIN domain-containing protein [Pyrodictium abyssi]
MTVLVDTGVFFAYYSLRDKYHMDSVALVIHMAEGRWGRAYITSHVLDETLNILKYRVSSSTAQAFIEAFIDRGIVRVIHADRETEEEALKLFRENIGRRGFSYTDAVTVATARRYGITHLLSYDVRSFTGLVEKITGPGYWDTLPSQEKDRILGLLRQRRKRHT